MWQDDLERALQEVEPSVLVERLDHDTVRVKLPSSPKMVIRSEYFTHVEGNAAHLLFYAERIVEKLRKESRK